VETPVKEEPRVVEEHPKVLEKIASKVIFTPVATIKLPDKNIFVRSVSNKRSHSLNPKTAHAGTIFLPVRGERVFQVGHEIKQKLAKYVKPAPKREFVTETLPKPIPSHTAIPAAMPLAAAWQTRPAPPPVTTTIPLPPVKPTVIATAEPRPVTPPPPPPPTPVVAQPTTGHQCLCD
jgi:hypothetical protein